MDIQDLRWHWDTFGQTDPMWAILTDPERRGNKWSPQEFFASGVGEIKCLIERIDWLGYKVSRRRALDFGCGLGRLTQALCAHFQECHGVDIAASMVEGARRYNQFGERCHYHVNTVPNLSLFPDNHFDLIYTIVVLQHMQPRYIRRYVQEFLRVLRPGGLAVFQIPNGAPAPELPEPEPLDRPLPNAAFRAAVTPRIGSLNVSAGATAPIPVNVKNTSAVLWPAVALPDNRFRLQLGNHWLRPDGSVHVQDDGRAPILRDLAPGDSAELALTVQAPIEPGEYRLQLDMVQEAVEWFAKRGSTAVTIPVTVDLAVPMPPVIVEIEPLSTIEEPALGTAQAEPFMEMYALRPLEVFRLVDHAGGKLLRVFDDSAAGGLETIYYATK